MPIAFSERGVGLLEGGGLMVLMREAEQQQMWDVHACPQGLITVAGARNLLMEDFWENYSRERLKALLLTCGIPQDLNYGLATGSRALQTAMAGFFNHHFDPASSISQEDVLATNGTSSLIEHLAWTIFDTGDAVILPTPTYAMFPYNLESRAGVRLLRVPMDATKDHFHRDFAADVVREFESVYEEATAKGIVIKAVLICNPHNPLGRCYSKETLFEIARFCRRHGLHLISDEIYAMTCFPTGDMNDNKSLEATPETKNLDTFTSALSIPDDDTYGKDTNNIHIVYGASKDFGMGGMRLGFLVTQNKMLRSLIAKLGMYSWVTVSSDAFFTQFISTPDCVDGFFDILRTRLRENYTRASEAMTKKGIPFSPANAGLFLWINLSEYLKYFKGADNPGLPLSPETFSREVKMCRWMVSRGLFISPGEMSESSESGHFRFTITVGKAESDASIERLASCLEELRSGGIIHSVND